MRAIGNLVKTCPVDFLHLETRLEPLDVRFRKLDEITWDRYRSLTSRSQPKAAILPPRPATTDDAPWVEDPHGSENGGLVDQASNQQHRCLPPG